MVCSFKSEMQRIFSSKACPCFGLVINGWIFAYFTLATWNQAGIVAALAAWSVSTYYLIPIHTVIDFKDVGKSCFQSGYYFNFQGEERWIIGQR